MCEICSKLTIKTPERLQLRDIGVLIVKSEIISPTALLLPLLILNKYQLGACFDMKYEPETKHTKKKLDDVKKTPT